MFGFGIVPAEFAALLVLRNVPLGEIVGLLLMCDAHIAAPFELRPMPVVIDGIIFDRFSAIGVAALGTMSPSIVLIEERFGGRIAVIAIRLTGFYAANPACRHVVILSAVPVARVLIVLPVMNVVAAFRIVLALLINARKGFKVTLMDRSDRVDVF